MKGQGVGVNLTYEPPDGLKELQSWSMSGHTNQKINTSKKVIELYI
jgi:hypothetical protein